MSEAVETYTVEPASESKHKANARLIAAAPELLETLQRIREDLLREFRPSVYQANFGYLDAVIAKATASVDNQ